jgi:hypothetical protein
LFSKYLAIKHNALVAHRVSYGKYRSSLIETLGFLSNGYLASQTGYFDLAVAVAGEVNAIMLTAG